MRIISAVFFLCVVSLNMWSQTMTAPDSSYLANLKSLLTLTEAQFDTVQTVYLKSQNEISVIDKELRIISRSDLIDSLKAEKSTQLTLKKKRVREMLELDLLLLLNEDQKKIYAEKIKPAKPDISHFGVMHDRAKCVVCIPGKP